MINSFWRREDNKIPPLTMENKFDPGPESTGEELSITLLPCDQVNIKVPLQGDYRYSDPPKRLASSAAVVAAQNVTTTYSPKPEDNKQTMDTRMSYISIFPKGGKAHKNSVGTSYLRWLLLQCCAHNLTSFFGNFASFNWFSCVQG